MPSPDVLLELEQFTCSRLGGPLFEPVDLRLSAGAVCAITGPNGIGKTTLLRALAGLVPFEARAARWFGRLLPAPDAVVRAELRLLGHALGLKPELSLAENLRFWASLDGGAPERAALDTALAQLGLDGYAELPVRTLSAGQRKRAALVRLILAPGRLWLLDEPFANLDGEGQRCVHALLRTQLERDGGVLFTHHGPLDWAGALMRLALRAPDSAQLTA